MRYILFILAIFICFNCFAQPDSLTPNPSNTQTVEEMMRQQYKTQDSMLQEQQQRIQQTGQRAIEESSEKSIELLKESDARKERMNKYIIIGVALLAGIIALIVRNRRQANKPV